MNKFMVILLIGALLFLQGHGFTPVFAGGCCGKTECSSSSDTCCVKGTCKCPAVHCCADNKCTCSKDTGCTTCKCG
jgi:hypothetical protein